MGTVSCGASWELTLSAGHGKPDYHAAQTGGWESQPPVATLTGPALRTDVCRGWESCWRPSDRSFPPGSFNLFFIFCAPRSPG